MLYACFSVRRNLKKINKNEIKKKRDDGSFPEKQENWHDAILRGSLVSRKKKKEDLFIFPVKNTQATCFVICLFGKSAPLQHGVSEGLRVLLFKRSLQSTLTSSNINWTHEAVQMCPLECCTDSLSAVSARDGLTCWP